MFVIHDYIIKTIKSACRVSQSLTDTWGFLNLPHSLFFLASCFFSMRMGDSRAPVLNKKRIGTLSSIASEGARVYNGGLFRSSKKEPERLSGAFRYDGNPGRQFRPGSLYVQ
jgi:hypothetical protein